MHVSIALVGGWGGPSRGNHTSVAERPFFTKCRSNVLDFVARMEQLHSAGCGQGIGYFYGKASMSGCVVIPIHNERGELIAYAGRGIDGSEPKYKLPVGFHKSFVLYNLHPCLERGEVSTVVVVEGFFDAIAVHRAGFPLRGPHGLIVVGGARAVIVQPLPVYSSCLRAITPAERGLTIARSCPRSTARKAPRTRPYISSFSAPGRIGPGLRQKARRKETFSYSSVTPSASKKSRVTSASPNSKRSERPRQPDHRTRPALQAGTIEPGLGAVSPRARPITAEQVSPCSFSFTKKPDGPGQLGQEQRHLANIRRDRFETRRRPVPEIIIGGFPGGSPGDSPTPRCARPRTNEKSTPRGGPGRGVYS